MTAAAAPTSDCRRRTNCRHSINCRHDRDHHLQLPRLPTAKANSTPPTTARAADCQHHGTAIVPPACLLQPLCDHGPGPTPEVASRRGRHCAWQWLAYAKAMAAKATAVKARELAAVPAVASASIRAGRRPRRARRDTAQRDPNVSARKAHTCPEQHSQQRWFDRSAHLLRVRWHRRRPPRRSAAERRQHREIIHLASARLHVSHTSGGTAAANSSGVGIARPDRTAAAAVTNVDAAGHWERAQWPP